MTYYRDVNGGGGNAGETGRIRGKTGKGWRD
jgi:hypothetical protein